MVDVPVAEDEVKQAVHQGEVGADLGAKVERGVLRGVGRARVDDDVARGVRAVEAVEHAGPKDGLLRGGVVADVEEGVGEVNIVEAAGLAVSAEGFAEGGFGGCGAKAGVGVEVGPRWRG